MTVRDGKEVGGEGFKILNIVENLTLIPEPSPIIWEKGT